MSDEPGGGGLTLGERIRNMESDIRATRDLLVDLVTRDRADVVRMETMSTRIGEKADTTTVKDLTGRVTKLEGSLTWAWRAAIGALIAAAIPQLVAALGG